MLQQGVWPFCHLQHPTPTIQGEHESSELCSNVSQNYFPLSSTYVNRHQEDENQSSEPALYVKHDNKISYLRWNPF